LLVLAGLGISPEHITMGLLAYLEKAGKIYLDTYTMPVSRLTLDFLKDRFPGKLVLSTRKTLEEESYRVLEEAEKELIVVLVPGDPLIATTHVSLVVEARRRGISTRVLPGISGVVASMTSTGLSYYKFGKTATIPGPWRGVKPYSTLATVYSNMCMGAHTLLLLDIDDKGAQLRPEDGIRTLLNLEREMGLSLLSRIKLLVVWDAGTGYERVVEYDLGSSSHGHQGGIASVVVPGDISKLEVEHVSILHGINLDYESHKRVTREACKALEAIENLDN